MKKVLAWAVALALVLSSFTMAFAADTAKTSKDFKDASSINYTEAVDVMVATGIINGFPDGTFGPQKTVKRSEMAKMIACIMNGGEDVGDQYKSACPFKDSQNHWAAGYIAYCSSEHIIDGRSADVFDPEATVTGTEVAKMALTSLGYDSKIQGYTGENWATNVLKDAKKNNLFEGLDKSFVPGDPCDRESAAQILFNMLKAVEVEYNNNFSVSTGDGADVTVSSKAEKIKSADSKVKDDNKDTYTNLYEDVFGGKLSFKKTDEDEFGRPAHSWTYDKKEVGTYSSSADYEFTAEDVSGTDPVKAAITAYDEDLATDLYAKVDNKDAYKFTYVLNGGQESTTKPAINLGDTIELYVTEADADATPAVEAAVKVVVIQYAPYKITDVDTDVSDAQAKEDITAVLTFTGEGSFSTANNKMAGYNEGSYVKDAVIAVALKNGTGTEVVDSYVLEEAVSGEASKVFGKPATAFTVDGTKYEITGDSYYDFEANVVAKEGNVYSFYDYNGYIIASVQKEKAEPEKFYGVIAKTKGESETADWDQDVDPNAKVYKVQMFTTDGEFKPLTINKECTNKPADDNALKALANKLVTYTVNEDGEIDSLTVATGDFNAKFTPSKTMNGTKVADEVAVFDIYKALENGQTTPEVKKTEDWAVLGINDLEKAEGDAQGKIAVAASIQKDKAYAAMLLAGPLEKAAKPETVIGFISNVEDYSVDNKDYADVTVWLADGTQKTYTTAEEAIGDGEGKITVAELKGAAKDEPVILTLESGDIASVNFAPTGEGVWTPVDEFKTEAGAAFDYAYYDVTKSDADRDIQKDGKYAKVSGTLTFGVTKIDEPPVSEAKVFFYDKGELSVSSLNQIKAANNAYAKIYQFSEDGVWNTVVFKNVAQ